MPYHRNEGRLPPETEIRDDAGRVTGHRSVHVRLFGGFDTRRAGHSPWPAAGGRPPTWWEISEPAHPFEIEFYEVQ